MGKKEGWAAEWKKEMGRKHRREGGGERRMEEKGTNGKEEMSE